MSAFRVSLLIAGVVLLAGPARMLAQRGGGGGAGGGGGMGGGRNTMPIICVHDCPALRQGMSAEDDLKNFRRVIAVQATADQRAAFNKIAQYAEAAGDQLNAFRESLQKTPASSLLSDRATALDQAIEKARASNQNFLTSFSSAQKSGLLDITKKMSKADSDLDKQIKALDQIVQASKPSSDEIASSAAILDKALASFQSEQLALGREMSILFDPTRLDVSFSLPPVTNTMTFNGQAISLPAAGAVFRTSSENGNNLFSLKLVADLSELQLNITGLLRSRLTRAPRCGERIEIQQATLTPLEPASLVVASLHYERWVCPPDSGRGSSGRASPGIESPMEVAAGDGAIEVKLTPAVEPKTGLSLVSETTRVEAEAFLRDLLRSGDLGVMLREQIAASVLSALQNASDLKTTLPPVAQQSATVQKVQFQDAGADQLNLLLVGQLQFSDEQTGQFAAQLKQRLSAQAATTP
jgi:hypothetical protein